MSKPIPSKKVLIVEDDFDVAKILVVRFRAAGFEIRHVQDGMYAMKEAREFSPNVIVLDLMLPAGGGWGVLRHVRLSSYTSTIPIIIYTGMQEDERMHEIEELGVQDYFLKPYDPQKIVERAEELIQGKE